MILKNNNEDYNNHYTENNNENRNFTKFTNKYKTIIMVLLIIAVVPITILLSMSFIESKKEVKNYLTLNGNEKVTIYRGTEYVEPGYNAYNSRKTDLSSFVEIDSTLNIDKIGTYEITYKLYDIVVTRKIEVIANPNEKTEIVLKSPNDQEDTDVYLMIGDEYIEPGYEVINNFDKEMQNEVKITGTVDTSKTGTYELTYSLIDPNEKLVSVTRKVIIMDIKIMLSKNTEDYTNKDVTINVKVEADHFDYLELPNKEKAKDKEYNYIVNTNGTYTFTVYNEKGFKKSTSIDIKNIDKNAPTGSCSGSYKDGVSTINVNASDNTKIKNYKINNKYYTNNKITINDELKQVSITISDEAGNTKNISCSLQDKNEVIISDKSITFSYKYDSDSATMPHALYTPSIASKGKPTPLIIWLHGSGEVGSNEYDFKRSGLLNVLNNWQKEGFNAYVLCPHLAKGTGLSNWHNQKTKNKIDELLEKIIKEHNIDQDKIVISGHSLGAIGVEYIAYNKPKYFSAMVVLSGYDTSFAGVKISELKYLPVLGFYGGSGYEHEPSYKYMKETFTETFGSENVKEYKTVKHGYIPYKAFNEDVNNDNKSDLIEWMLTKKRNY